MNCCPQDTGSVIQVTVTLDIDHDAIAALCRQRSADRSRSTIAHAACAAPAGGGGDAAESDIGAIALQQCRESRTDDGCLSSGNLQTQCVIVGCAGTGST